MRFFLGEPPFQSRIGKSRLSLRIGNLPFPSKCLKLFSPSAAHGIGQIRVSVTGEIQKGSRLAVLFTHEEQRHERRKQINARGQFQAFEIDK
jgi:hypothetical protein